MTFVMDDKKFEEMYGAERDKALLDLINSLATVTELQGEAIGRLDERIQTLELESVV